MFKTIEIGDLNMNSIPRLLITPGEPAGIGPDIAIKAAHKTWPAELVVIVDPELLEARATQLGLPLTLHSINLTATPTLHQPGTLKIIPVSLNTKCEAGKLNSANSSYVMKTLEIAVDCCLKNQAHALVTGPVHKAIMNNAGIHFTGHTEFLAARSKTSQVVMCFMTDKMKVALVTTHLPLSEVSKAITEKKLLDTIRLVAFELEKKFQIQQPCILVCGLNPHAGENGHLGREEIDIIEPALAQLRKENFNVQGPLPADTIFTDKYLKKADVVIAMYHDQALPVVKFQGFHAAVNITLGLPFIRTSVDHGTALDVAGTSHADAGSLEAAIKLATTLSS